MHLYDASEMNWQLEDGTELRLVQKTNFPWNGDVQITVTPETSRQFTVFVRIPGWSQKTAVRVNGTPVEGIRRGEYLALRRVWKPGSTIDLAFDMSPQKIEANPAVKDDVGKLAFQRGPVVFCMESLDQTVRSRQVNLADFAASKSGATTSRFEPALLDGVVVVEHQGMHTPATESLGLYHTTAEQEKTEETALRFIPYYAWANREPAAMQVWVPIQQA